MAAFTLKDSDRAKLHDAIYELGNSDDTPRRRLLRRGRIINLLSRNERFDKFVEKAHE